MQYVSRPWSALTRVIMITSKGRQKTELTIMDIDSEKQCIYSQSIVFQDIKLLGKPKLID